MKTRCQKGSHNLAKWLNNRAKTDHALLYSLICRVLQHVFVSAEERPKGASGATTLRQTGLLLGMVSLGRPLAFRKKGGGGERKKKQERKKGSRDKKAKVI